jgi:LPS export ABC transporter permease LptF/LPS export ABC transporter permease LptG
MLKTVDRYVFREMVPPFLVGLLLLVFVLLMNQVLLLAELFIDKGVPAGEALRILGLLLPSILTFAVPMAVLTGILAGLARLSADSEVVALRSLGMSARRLARPVLLFALCGWAVTSALALWIAPRANHQWVLAMTDSVLARVRLKVHPLEFNETVPNMVFLVQDVGRDGEWRNVFAFFGRDPLDRRVVMARRGRIRLFPDEKRAVLELAGGLAYSASPAEPEKDSLTAFEKLEEEIPVESLFASISSEKRVREKDIAELRRDLAALRTQPDGGPPREIRAHAIEIHKKFALPFVCLIFVLLGLPLGIRTGRAGRIGGFSLSMLVIFLYYALLTAGEKLAMDGKLGPWLGMWGPDIVLAAAGLFLFLRADRERPGWDSLARLLSKPPKDEPVARPAAPAGGRGREIRFPRLPFPDILDRYVARKFAAVLGLVFSGLLAATALVMFFERLDDVLRRGKPLGLLVAYVGFRLPEFLAFILPVAVLATALLSLGLLTRSNETLAVRSCGISLHRLALPVLALAVLASGAAFLVQERVVPAAHVRSEAAWSRITDLPPRSYSYLNRHWILGRDGDRIYHYDYFDPAASVFSRLSVFDLDLDGWSLRRRTFAEKATLSSGAFLFERGWVRDYEGGNGPAFARRETGEIATREGRTTFLKARRDPLQMTWGELRDYAAEVRDMGFRATRLRVELGQKTALPFVSLVMALLAVPFAFSMGKKGTLTGIGASVIIAMAYWGAFAVFRSLGHTEVLPPWLAAWGANLIFGLAGAAGFFRLRT